MVCCELSSCFIVLGLLFFQYLCRYSGLSFLRMFRYAFIWILFLNLLIFYFYSSLQKFGYFVGMLCWCGYQHALFQQQLDELYPNWKGYFLGHDLLRSRSLSRSLKLPQRSFIFAQELPILFPQGCLSCAATPLLVTSGCFWRLWVGVL